LVGSNPSTVAIDKHDSFAALDHDDARSHAELGLYVRMADIEREEPVITTARGHGNRGAFVTTSYTRRQWRIAPSRSWWH
jgi:hypothetical protein